MTAWTPSNVEELEERLGAGGGLSRPELWADALAHSFRATIFFSNAGALCRDQWLGDFRVFGALYQMRHGLELLLKCLLLNERLNRFFSLAFEHDATFERVAEVMELTTLERRAFSDGLEEVMRRRVARPDADAFNWFRACPDLARGGVARSIPLVVHGHRLCVLWSRARGPYEFWRLRLLADAEFGGDVPVAMSTDALGAAVEWLDKYDEAGDAFRYPTSRAGELYSALPRVRLDRLGDLAEALENSARAMWSVRLDAEHLPIGLCVGAFSTG